MANWRWHDSCQARRFSCQGTGLRSVHPKGHGPPRQGGQVTGFQSGRPFETGFFDSQPALAEGGAFAEVEDFGGAQEGDEGGEVAFEVEEAGEAAEGHLGALAVAVAVPVAPDEVGGGDADGGGTVEEGAEGPVDRG